MNIKESEFLKYKKSNKAFPVFIQINGDLDTPVGLFYKLQGEKKFLLESIPSEKENGRYSFLGADPYKVIRSYGDDVEITSEEEKSENYKGRVLDYIKEALNCDYEGAGLDIPFTGGAVGYVGYDVIRQYERLPDDDEDELKLPEAYMMFYKDYICYDHYKHQIIIVHNVLPDAEESYDSAVVRLNSIKRMISESKTLLKLAESNPYKEFCGSNMSEDRYCEAVEKAKEYIKSGDIFQVVLSQRMKYKTESKPFDIYRRLRQKNPSPYLFYIDFGDLIISGSSPECLVKVEKGIVTTNPIAGTRPRGKSDDEDERLKMELLSDEKEIAEHVMLLDLGRNDIGRISEFGSVSIDRYMEVERYSHVMHIVSVVSGKLRKSLSCFDALSSCLPVGTVSGAPKVRAMEIIDELENVRRGVYAGAVGCFSYNGYMDTCIAIRTIVFKEDMAYVQSGAGIVYDSIPQSEYKESLNKAMAMKEVL